LEIYLSVSRHVSVNARKRFSHLFLAARAAILSAKLKSKYVLSSKVGQKKQKKNHPAPGSKGSVLLMSWRHASSAVKAKEGISHHPKTKIRFYRCIPEG
jgi:hypothetical protein